MHPCLSASFTFKPPGSTVVAASLPFHVCLPIAAVCLYWEPVVSYSSFLHMWPCPHEVTDIPARLARSVFKSCLLSVLFWRCPGFELIMVDPLRAHTHTQRVTLAWFYPLTQPAAVPLIVEQHTRWTRRMAGFLLQGTLETHKSKHTHSYECTRRGQACSESDYADDGRRFGAIECLAFRLYAKLTQQRPLQT